jgi:hypothetical protein
MPKRADNEGGELNLEELVSSAVQQGLSVIVRNNPKLKGRDLGEYLDREALSKYTGKFAQELQRVPEKDRPEYVRRFYDILAKYTASGELFNEVGKELFLKYSWRKEAKRILPTRGKREAKELLAGEERLEGIKSSFRELYDIMTTEGYAQRMPDIANAVATVYQGGFFDATLNVLYANKKLDKGRYLTLKRALREKLDRGVRLVEHRLEQYLGQAAIVFGGIGLFVLIAIAGSNAITGNIIGITSSNSFPALIFGFISLIAGVFLWVKKRKKFLNHTISIHNQLLSIFHRNTCISNRNSRF